MSPTTAKYLYGSAPASFGVKLSYRAVLLTVLKAFLGMSDPSCFEAKASISGNITSASVYRSNTIGTAKIFLTNAVSVCALVKRYCA